MNSTYKGRFAPTPSGPAHLGTLLAAVGSYLQARASGGEWYVRIDDIDPPREVPGAADSILRTLEHYGLQWDGEIVYQSHRLDAYRDALHQLAAMGVTYECSCSRKQVDQVARRGMNGMIYPGTCRSGCEQNSPQTSVRLRTDDVTITVEDLIQPALSVNMESDIGDYIILRADKLFAYHLATVVDDALDGFTEIVRGKDQYSLTPQHIFLQQKLGVETPQYAHLPLLTNQRGEKLAKSSQATAVDSMLNNTVWSSILTALGMQADPGLLKENNETILHWALGKWDLLRIDPADKIIK